MGPDALAQVLCCLPKFNDPNLLVGFDTNDDAAVYKLDEETALIQTVDIFPPVVDDPYTYGQIAAANSLSDVYAMGGIPKLCMNILCVPENLPKDTVKSILEGGYNKVKEADAIIAGGHTIKDNEPKYGLSVTGFVKPSSVLTNSNMAEGDLLIVTKPIGNGVLSTAIKAGLISGSAEREVINSMCMLNKEVHRVMIKFPVSSCTDITGFGLLGHAHEMAAGSQLSIHLNSTAIPFFSEAREMASMGIIPAGAYANRNFLSEVVVIKEHVPLNIEDLLFDPQTSGGLLISLPENRASSLLRELRDVTPCAEIIGTVVGNEDYTVLVE